MPHPTIKQLARAFLPRRWVDAVVERFFRVRWEGDYPDWPAAQRHSTGYDTDEILQKVVRATRAVRDGQARYERDGVVFQDEPPPWPALPYLQAAVGGGRLSVLDFGGALGSTYFQYRREIPGANHVTWAVVEQPMFVNAGAAEFESEELRFFPTVQAASAAVKPDVLILSGVIQCLEEPHALLTEFLRAPWRLIVLDRVALHAGTRDRLTVQKVPSSIYRASYPAWFFQQERLMAHFAQRYRCVAEFANGDPGSSGFRFMGFLFEPKES